MSIPKIVHVTKEEVEAGISALDYYLDTLTRCSFHNEDEHGDETECEGWGPQGIADLTSLTEKLRKV